MKAKKKRKNTDFSRSKVDIKHWVPLTYKIIFLWSIGEEAGDRNANDDRENH